MQVVRKTRSTVSAFLLAFLAFGLVVQPNQVKAAPGTVQVGFSTTASVGLEGSSNVITIDASQIGSPNHGNIEVAYSIAGTATSDTDYTRSGNAKILAGESSTNIVIDSIDDSDVEGNETVVLTITGLSDSEGTSFPFIGTDTFTHTIIDTDSALEVNLVPTSASGDESLPGSFTVSLNQVTSTDVTFQWNSDAGTALAGSVDPANDYSNYAIAWTTSTIPAGQLSTTISFGVNDDNWDENNEVIVVAIGNPVGATLGSFNSFSYTIIDNDTSVAEFAAAESSDVNEGSGAQFEVDLNKPSVRDQVFAVTVLGSSSATQGTDFALASNFITILAGQIKTDVHITTVDDADPEADENVVVEISGDLGSTVGTVNTHTFIIKENDGYVVPTPVYGTAIPQSTASVGGVPVGSIVVVPVATTPAPANTPATPGQVLGVQITLLDELIAKLKPGTTSDEVKTLQTELQKLGFFVSSFKPTRYYGSMTKAAVAKYLDSKAESMSLDQLVATLKFGQRGSAVKKLQTELKSLGFFPADMGITGYFGAVTKAAVAKYLASK